MHESDLTIMIDSSISVSKLAVGAKPLRKHPKTCNELVNLPTFYAANFSIILLQRLIKNNGYSVGLRNFNSNG